MNWYIGLLSAVGVFLAAAYVGGVMLLAGKIFELTKNSVFWPWLFCMTALLCPIAFLFGAAVSWPH